MFISGSIKKIIISRTDKIGDLVLSIPSFFMLRKMYPEAEICVLVRNYNYEIVKNLPYLNRIIKIDDYSEVELIRELKKFKADVFIALFSNSFIARLARKSRAKWRVGPYSKITSFFSYNKGIRQHRSQSIKNEAEYNLDLVRKLAPSLFDSTFEISTEIYYSVKHRQVAEKFINSNQISRIIIVINPFTGGSAKNITDEQYRELLIAIRENIKADIILTCHISERTKAEAITEGIDSVFVFANDGDLLNLAALIDNADVYLGGSTGPTHIAGSLQKNIVALYPIRSALSPTRWGVFNNPNVVYICPEGNKEEDYSTKYFQSYGEKDKTKIVESIINFIN